MPAYDFICKNCGHHFEQMMSASDNTDTVTCPNCSAHAHKVFSPPTIIFKGHGFYSTDNRDKSKPNNS